MCSDFIWLINKIWEINVYNIYVYMYIEVNKTVYSIIRMNTNI